MVSKLKQQLKKFEILTIMYDKLRLFYWKYFTSDKKLLNKKFRKCLGRDIEWKNPIKFNDKLQWLKLNWYDPIATKCVDKYEVRVIIKEKIGEEYLNELIAVYDFVDEIDIDKLPSKFVLKATHSSGYNLIVADKSKVDWEREFKNMKRWLRRQYYWGNREWVYRNVKPRIVCEQYLQDKDGLPPKDYKIFCFNGNPKLIAVDFAKYGENKDEDFGLKRNLYDLDWNFLNYTISVNNDPDTIHDKPKCLQLLISLGKILSKGFPHVRVDFFIVNNKIYFGELTFFNTSGMGKIYPEEFEIQMGNWLKLPNNVNQV